LKNFI